MSSRLLDSGAECRIEIERSNTSHSQISLAPTRCRPYTTHEILRNAVIGIIYAASENRGCDETTATTSTLIKGRSKATRAGSIPTLSLVSSQVRNLVLAPNLVPIVVSIYASWIGAYSRAPLSTLTYPGAKNTDVPSHPGGLAELTSLL